MIFYHLSAKDHGEELRIARRAPLLRTHQEPLTPRICVAPTIAGCLAAVLIPKPVVYVVERRSSVNPVGVWDKLITGERWLIPPVVLRRSHVLDARSVYVATLLRLEQKKGITWRVRLAQFVVASRFTGERTRAERLWRRFGTGDPEEMIMGL